MFCCVQPLLFLLDPNICSKDENKCATPLQVAARFNSPATARLLLFRGADVAKKSTYGQQALHYAARRGNLAVVEVIKIMFNCSYFEITCEPHSTVMV